MSGPVAERTAVRPCVVQGPLFLSPNNPGIGVNSTTITEGVNAVRITVEIRVNEFYKKGCQEKSSASTGGSRFFLEIQPTLFRYL